MACQMQQGCIGDIEAGRGRKRLGRLGTVLAAAIGAVALLGGTAQASTVTIGSVLPPISASVKFEGVKTFFNTALPEKGASLTSPVTGIVLRWRVVGAKGGPFYLRVLHPNGKGQYEATGTSLAATPTGPDLQTFTTNLPIRAGDQIAIDPTSKEDEIGVSDVAGAKYETIFPPPFNGTTVAPSSPVEGKEILLSAEVQAAPEITAVTPRSGSVKGGTKVTVKGSGLAGAGGVTFGTVPATSFTVESDTQLTATVPAAKKPGKVDVAVTTVAGTSATARADTFTYLACVVPRLTGKKLGVAKDRLADAGCKLGKVKKVAGPAKKAGKVVKQNPKAGKILAPGAKVSVNVVRK